MADRVIRRALIAVYDKTGIVEFARALVDEFGIEIISTGGTARHLKEAGIPVTMVEQVTGFPEMLDGRVKTLHPKIHAAILADRDNPEHMRQLAEQGIAPIDMVVVNLYPFEKTVADPNCTFEQAIEMIDIGGPCMLRAAAKNHKDVLAVNSPYSYEPVLRSMRGLLFELPHLHLIEAMEVFKSTVRYDASIIEWLSRPEQGGERAHVLFREFIDWGELRYGENPHQQAKLLGDEDNPCSIDLTTADAFFEKRDSPKPALSFNNYIDADAALGLCAELVRAATILAPPGLKSGAQKVNNEPRTSVRAAAQTPVVVHPDDILAQPDSKMPAWFLTWTTYGSWLPGDDRGFVSRAPREDGSHAKRNVPGTSYDVAQGDLEESARARMKGKPVKLSIEQARVVAESFIEVARTHQVTLIAFSIMEDHVHLLCQGTQDGGELQRLFKGVSSRRLGQAFSLQKSARWWTEGGSKRHIRPGEDLTGVIDYVCSQKRPLVVRCVDESRNVGSWVNRNIAQSGSAARTGSPGLVVESVEDARTKVPELSTCVFIKHTNACGVGIAKDSIEAYRQAYLGDPNAAMGGILAVNFPVDATFAEVIMETLQRFKGDAERSGCQSVPQAFFLEVLVAPSFDEDAVEVIRTRKKWGANVRLLTVGDMNVALNADSYDYKSIAGGMMVQSRDLVGLNEEQWKVVTQRAPTDKEMADLRLAWLIAKHTKSNAISLCKDGMLIGNGAGQMSRVMSCRIATWLARENGHADKLAGAVAASDAFFPFRDGPDLLMEAGISAIIQPGGSKRDEDTIAACNERSVAMIFTGTRHFKH